MAELEKNSVTKVQVVGPTDGGNGAEILRFHRDGKKQPLDITRGQVLAVGDGKNADITQAEAQRLLNYSRWEVKEVNE